jgi:hypothetical protein
MNSKLENQPNATKSPNDKSSPTAKTQVGQIEALKEPFGAAHG